MKGYSIYLAYKVKDANCTWTGSSGFRDVVSNGTAASQIYPDQIPCPGVIICCLGSKIKLKLFFCKTSILE